MIDGSVGSSERILSLSNVVSMKNKRGKERRGRGKKDGTGKGCGVGRCCGTQALYAVSGRPNGRITSHQALAQSANRSYSSVKVPRVMYQHGSHVVAHIRGQRHQDNRDRQERVRLLGKVTTPGNRFQRGEVADYAPPVGSFVRFAVQTRNKHT